MQTAITRDGNKLTIYSNGEPHHVIDLNKQQEFTVVLSDVPHDIQENCSCDACLIHRRSE